MSTASQAGELKKFSCICYYPSSGTDLSDLDYFCSGRRLYGERVESQVSGSANFAGGEETPDLFIHTDVNFYQEFSSGLDELPDDCGMHGSFEVLEYKELPVLAIQNRIAGNFEFTGSCFSYRLRVWGSEKVVTLLFCLCENEAFVADFLLAHGIEITYIWSRNWAGGQTYGTWLANVLDRLHTEKVYTDWLCVPGQRGEPRNRRVEEKYPELMAPAKVKLQRNNEVHWIDEGANGWVEEFYVTRTG